MASAFTSKITIEDNEKKNLSFPATIEMNPLRYRGYALFTNRLFDLGGDTLLPVLTVVENKAGFSPYCQPVDRLGSNHSSCIAHIPTH